LILSGNTLYGAAGNLFKVNTDGTGFTNFYSFTALLNNTNSDGSSPWGGLLLSGTTIYGTAENGGSTGYGTVFAVSTSGSGFMNLHNFSAISVHNGINSDGAYPQGTLILSGNILYGTADEGGGSGLGAIFCLNTDGSGFTNLHSFYGIPYEGAYPQSGLILSGNILYGTSAFGNVGSSSSDGTVFSLNANGTAVSTLHSFTSDNAGTNWDGSGPEASLVISGNRLYGVTYRGGSSGYGTVFAVNTDGNDFTVLHNFSGYPTDGANPAAGLILSANALYGTTAYGGSHGTGTIFSLNTDGTVFAILHNFTAISGGTNSDGANPQPVLVLSGNTLYGTALDGGAYGVGTVFSISWPVPQLSATHSGTNFILAWPSGVSGFWYNAYALQYTTNLVSPFSWKTNLPTPIILAGQNTVTVPITSPEMFFRLSQ
jgi:uncharacterized repeat protein (TIGR03803 family)